MTAEQPTYWLAYISEATVSGPPEITATAPEILDRPRLNRDARVVLAAADAYHAAHSHERVVFAAAVTRWLNVDKRIRWCELDTDFDDALAELDSHAPALMVQASPIAMAVVANAALHLNVFVVGRGVEEADRHTESVRTAIQAALDRDWPVYVRRVVRAELARFSHDGGRRHSLVRLE